MGHKNKNQKSCKNILNIQFNCKCDHEKLQMFCLLYINYKRDNVQKYHSYAAYKKHKTATVGTRTFNA